MKQQTDFSDYKFRCSSLGKLMVNPRTKKDALSVTTKNYLNEIHKEIVFGKSTEIQSKYLDKGKQVEGDSLKLINSVLAKDYTINEKHFIGKKIQGTPDIIADPVIIDIKSSWDFTTFPMHAESLPTKDYYWQMQGYMALLGLKEARVVYCLVDTPATIIQDEIRRISWSLGMIEVPMELEAEVYERLLYSDIPGELRLKEFAVEYNEEDIERLYQRIDICREYLTDLSVGLGERILKPII